MTDWAMILPTLEHFMFFGHFLNLIQESNTYMEREKKMQLTLKKKKQ